MQDPPLLAVLGREAGLFLGQGRLAPRTIFEFVGVPRISSPILGCAKPHPDLMNWTDDDGFFFIFLVILLPGFSFRMVLLSGQVFRMRFFRVQFFCTR